VFACRASTPNAVLPVPVVLAQRDLKPTAKFSDAVVLALREK
jgi:hypothetical protein